jgi:hypothetical protein
MMDQSETPITSLIIILLRPEWTSTHQRTNVDGWMDAVIGFSALFYPCVIPGWLFWFVLSQPFLRPDLRFLN